jgi:hypothetical protein
MNMKILRGALMVGAVLALTASSGPSLAQSNEATAPAPKSVSKNVGATKHIHWRHRGGKHPHYGSRRVNTETRTR